MKTSKPSLAASGAVPVGSETQSDVDTTHNDLNKKIAKRVEALWQDVPYTEVPPMPKHMLVEVANICNHACVFCAYTKMTRPKGVLSKELFSQIAQQAFDLGVREVGLYSGAEPLTVKHIDLYVQIAKRIGFNYVYMTTNGSLGTQAKFRQLIDAGLDSLKFSINGADRQTYKRVHGKDHFDIVIENLKYVSEYRKSSNRQIYLAVSFVETSENEGTFDKLKEMVGEWVDEIFFTVAYNQAGQMEDRPAHTFKKTCAVPFSQVNISREGYLRLCCNDYQNHLAVEDLSKMSLSDAWASASMRDIRRRHMTGDLKGTLCHNCIHGTRETISPLNFELSDLPQI